MRKLRVTIAEFHCFFALLISRSFSGKALNSGWGLRRAKHMGWRHTETYLDRRAVYSEAGYLKSVLLWLQGHSGPLGGMPKVSNNYAHEKWLVHRKAIGVFVILVTSLSTRRS